MTPDTLLTVLAFAFFLWATIEGKNLVAAGLACLTATLLF